MRVSLLPPVIPPGRIYELLLAGELVPALRPAGDLVLRGRLDTASSGVVGRPGGGLARLVGVVARDERCEGRRSGDEVELELPEQASAWMLDRALLWRVLAGVGQSGAGRPAPPRRVDGSELLTLADQPSVWTVQLAPGGRAGDQRISWLVVEEHGGTSPSRETARDGQRLRDLVRSAGYSAASLRVRPQDLTAVPSGSAFMRLDEGSRRVYWPLGSLRGMCTLLAGAPAASWDELQLRAQASLLDLLVEQEGLLRLAELLPRTPAERAARLAARTVQALIREEGASRRALADTTFRTGELYRAMSGLLPWLGAVQQRSMRHGMAGRRWEQVHQHGLRRVPASTERQRPIWDRCAEAARILVEDLAARSEQAGRRPPAAAVTIVRQLWIEPRSDRMQAIWREQLERGQLRELLSEVMLSRLRRDIPRLPREDVVLVQAGESEGFKQRVQAAFSRRGRLTLGEDVAVTERAISEGRFRDWDRLLAARSRLAARYARRPRSRSRISPA